ncbi:MAG: FMN-binding protein [Clostridia bacterium]|nr:FMN-binding protein [Clostridia bacterium]
MGDIFKLALRLFVFALVAAVALAMTNEVTKGPIEAQKLAAKMEALNTVLPGCEYAQIEYEGLAEGSTLDEIFEAKDASGATVGYALTAAPQGYGGPIPITVGISTEGHITQTFVGALQETAGLGTKVGEADFKDQFIAIAADPDTLNDDVDTIGGATVSSSAFVNAVSEILTYSKNTLNIAPAAGDKEAILAAAAAAAGNAEPVITTNTYDVNGFGPMKVEVAVDDAGKIVSVKVLEHGETPGFGADLIADTAVFDALVGQDIAGAAIDVKAGVTMTSKGINAALKAAGPQVPTDPYTVKGFGKFTMNVAVQDGAIAAINAPVHNETPGFGADILTEDALAYLVGQDIATVQVDMKSGVTMTSNAIADALKQAAAANGIVVEAAEAAPAADVTSSASTATAAPAAAETAAAGNVYDVKGFQPMKVAVDVDADGKIVSVSVVEHNETPGFGADLIGAGFDALVGQDIATAAIDVKSGVTMTSNGMNDALKAAAAAAPAAEAAPAAAGNVYDVKGFQPMKVAVEVDEAGKIVSVAVTEHNETPGFGADLIGAGFDALVGQDIATAAIDVKSGVTMTSNGINEALKAAAAAAPAAEAAPVEEAAAVTAEVAKVYEVSVMGMNSKHPLTLSISVDAEGVIVSAVCTDSSEDRGAAALAEEALAALVGQNITDAKYDTVAGATVTSNAVNQALDTIAAYVRAEEVQ